MRDKLKGDLRCPGWRSSNFQVEHYKSKVQKWWDLKAYDVNTLSELSKEFKFLVIHGYSTFFISVHHSFLRYLIPNSMWCLSVYHTQWTKMRKHDERVWIKHPMQHAAYYCIPLEEELCLAHKELCMEKVWTMNTMNSLMSWLFRLLFYSHWSTQHLPDQQSKKTVCKCKSWPAGRKEHLPCNNDDEEDLVLQLIHRLSGQ